MLIRALALPREPTDFGHVAATVCCRPQNEAAVKLPGVVAPWTGVAGTEPARLPVELAD